MPKILSEIKKKEMVEAFKNGFSLEELEIKYGLKRLTIVKHLKSFLSENEFKKLSKLHNKQKSKDPFPDNDINDSSNLADQYLLDQSLMNSKNSRVKEINSIQNSSSNEEGFFEIPPLKENFDFESRKDLTSKPLEGFSLPEDVFMLIDKNIELNVFLIKDFPEYSYLPEVDQKRKIIKLFSNKKNATSYCGKNQKVIKVPNVEVFKLVSPILLKKGITRIILDDYLLSI